MDAKSLPKMLSESAPTFESHIPSSFVVVPPTVINEQPISISASKKMGSHFPPVFIMLAMVLLGLTLFFALPYPSAVPNTQIPWFQMDGGTLYFHEIYYSGSSEVEVPSTIDGQTVTVLGKGCFQGCTDMTTAFLPETLEIIESYAFSGCNAMRGIFIPESVCEIRSGAFENCTELEAICIPEGIESIGSGAFASCHSLHYIFYCGYIEDWYALYSEYISPFTYVICYDGYYPQGGGMP